MTLKHLINIPFSKVGLTSNSYITILNFSNTPYSVSDIKKFTEPSLSQNQYDFINHQQLYPVFPPRPPPWLEAKLIP